MAVTWSDSVRQPVEKRSLPGPHIQHAGVVTQAANFVEEGCGQSELPCLAAWPFLRWFVRQHLLDPADDLRIAKVAQLAELGVMAPQRRGCH